MEKVNIYFADSVNIHFASHSRTILYENLFYMHSILSYIFSYVLKLETLFIYLKFLFKMYLIEMFSCYFKTYFNFKTYCLSRKITQMLPLSYM